MDIRKAVITAASKHQRALPLQTLIDQDGVEKSVLGILVDQALDAGIEEICVVVYPGDEQRYAETVADNAKRLHLVPQTGPQGYGAALYSTREFVADDPFLHLVGDHLYVSRSQDGCARRLLEVARTQECAVSAVQETRESMLPYFGCVAGPRLPGQADLYQVERVLEKPTPTMAEQFLVSPGLRAGYYLCFFGMHVLTPTVIELIGAQLEASKDKQSVCLADALAELPQREQYLALEQQDRRYDIGVKYGLLTAQLALALNGQDRDEILARLLELLAQRELCSPSLPAAAARDSERHA